VDQFTFSISVFSKLNVFLCIAAIAYKLDTAYSFDHCHLYFGSVHMLHSVHLWKTTASYYA